MKLDAFDRKILNALQNDGRITNADLSKVVGLSASACLRRLNGLMESGLVKNVGAILNQTKVGFHGTAFLTIKLERQNREDLDRFEQQVVRIPEVIECHLLAGDMDYLLKLVYRDNRDFERLHAEHITKLPGVMRVVTSMALRCVNATTVIPL